MGNDVHVTDAHRGIAEEAGVTVVVLMIVTQDDVSHWNVITAIELSLEPLRCARVAVMAVDDDDPFIRQDEGAVLVVGAPAVDML